MQRNPERIVKAFLLLLTAGCLASCEKVAEFVEPPTNSMDTEYYEMDFTVESSDKNGFQIFSEETYSNDINNLLVQAGFNPDKIESVILKEATVNLEGNVNYPDFDILKFIELTVYTDLLREKKVAWSDPVPADLSSLTLDLSEENLLPYFREGTFIITVQGFLKQRIYENLDLHARVKFRVKWKV
jgi:hypothetical protein